MSLIQIIVLGHPVIFIKRFPLQSLGTNFSTGEGNVMERTLKRVRPL